MSKFVQPAWNDGSRPLVWDSEYFAVAADQTYTLTHNLNRQPLFVQVWFSTSATGGAEHAVNGVFDYYNAGDGSHTNYGCYIRDVGETTLKVNARANVGLNSAGTWQTSGYYRVLVWA